MSINLQKLNERSNDHETSLGKSSNHGHCHIFCNHFIAILNSNNLKTA